MAQMNLSTEKKLMGLENRLVVAYVFWSSTCLIPAFYSLLSLCHFSLFSNRRDFFSMKETYQFLHLQYLFLLFIHYSTVSHLHDISLFFKESSPDRASRKHINLTFLLFFFFPYTPLCLSYINVIILAYLFFLYAQIWGYKFLKGTNLGLAHLWGLRTLRLSIWSWWINQWLIQ